MPKKDISKLVGQYETIVRKNGTTFQQLIYVDPNKKVKQPTYSKPYKNAAADKVAARKNTGTVRVDHTDLQRGDKVHLTVGGQQVEGEFRHIAVSDRYPKGVAVIKVGDKMYERKPDAVQPVDKPHVEIKTETGFERRKAETQFSVGDRVKFTMRGRDERGNPISQEVIGNISRFKPADKQGQLIHIKLDDGTTKERYLHNVTRYSERLSNPLTTVQATAINKATLRLTKRNEEDFALIKVLTGKRGSEEKIAEAKKAIEARNLQMTSYLQVLKREMPFEDLHEFHVEQPEPVKPKKHTLFQTTIEAISDAIAESGPPVQIQTDPHEEMLNDLNAKIELSQRNLSRYAKQPASHERDLQIYRSTKNQQANMSRLIGYKVANKLELTPAEKLYQTQTPAPPVKPKKPEVETGPATTSTPMKRTITTVGKTVAKKQKEVSNEAKRQELITLIEKTKKLGLNESTEKVLLDRYEGKLAKLGKPVTTAKPKGVDKNSIQMDILKVANGHSPASLKINDRITALDISEEEKSALRSQFGGAIKQRIKLQKEGDKAAKQAITGTANVELDLTKAVTVPDSIYNVIATQKQLKMGNALLLRRDLFKALPNTPQFNTTEERVIISDGNTTPIEITVVTML